MCVRILEEKSGADVRFFSFQLRENSRTFPKKPYHVNCSAQLMLQRSPNGIYTAELSERFYSIPREGFLLFQYKFYRFYNRKPTETRIVLLSSKAQRRYDRHRYEFQKKVETKRAQRDSSLKVTRDERSLVCTPNRQDLTVYIHKFKLYIYRIEETLVKIEASKEQCRRRGHRTRRYRDRNRDREIIANNKWYVYLHVA